MARIPFLSRRRGDVPAAEAEAPAADADAPVPIRRPLPSPARLRRERRTLLRLREQRIRDLGGLVLEMYRRQAFRQDLVDEQSAELVSIEDRLHELDALLAAAVSVRRAAPAARCECGAPILWGSHFCANCGRSLGARPVVACSNCGSALQAGAQFCPSCGHRVEAEQAGDGAGAEP
ncbi:MAG TPA: zinc ribbon domain-containing protein [Gaiellaceae bacterium]|nr:zinc ribbon domain-containing protein [Gaiellaceae bacterium]